MTTLNPAALTANTSPADRLSYNQHASAWLADTLHHSSMAEITKHQMFAKLVSMGDRALRLTLERLEKGDVKLHWFPLLKRIAGLDPVPEEDRGHTDRMAQHWIAWGRRSGKI